MGTLRPDAVRITLTGKADLETARTSINDGRIRHLLLGSRLLERICYLKDAMPMASKRARLIGTSFEQRIF